LLKIYWKDTEKTIVVSEQVTFKVPPLLTLKIGAQFCTPAFATVENNTLPNWSKKDIGAKGAVTATFGCQ
jgi:hypothetical protein